MKLSSLFSSVFSAPSPDAEILARPQISVYITEAGDAEGEEILVGDERDWRSRHRYENTVRQLLRQGSFVTIEYLMKHLRAKASRFPGGNWKLYHFYQGLTLIPEATDAEWNIQFQVINHWLSERPDSITAIVAAGKTMASYAWKARTGRLAEEVPDEAWALFSERLNEAADVLTNAPEQVRECPEWYVTLMTVARGQGWDIAEHTRLYEAGCAVAPAYERLHAERATFLLPRWHGQEGDAIHAINKACQLQGKPADSATYLFIMRELLRLYEVSVTGTSELQLDASRILDGIEAVESLYGTSLQSLNTAALFGRLINNKEVTERALRQINANWDWQLWGEEKYFKAAMKWAGL